MCKVVLVWIVIKEEKTVDVGVGVRARVQYIRDSQQIEREGPRVRAGFPREQGSVCEHKSMRRSPLDCH